MNNMSAKVQNAVALWCHAAAIGLFENFSNKSYQGLKFTWDGFPDMVAEYCGNMVFINVQYPEGMRKEVEDHASATGREIAEKLVKCVNNLQS